MNITKRSQLTGIEHTREIECTEEGMQSWLSGNYLIQRAFPNLSADDREFILTGITPEEWLQAFGSEDDEED